MVDEQSVSADDFVGSALLDQQVAITIDGVPVADVNDGANLLFYSHRLSEYEFTMVSDGAPLSQHVHGAAGRRAGWLRCRGAVAETVEIVEEWEKAARNASIDDRLVRRWIATTRFEFLQHFPRKHWRFPVKVPGNAAAVQLSANAPVDDGFLLNTPAEGYQGC